MRYEKPLIEGRFLKRYKRFFADICVKNKVITAHVPNSGSMKGCLFNNAPCLVSFHDDPARKLQYTLEMIQTPTSWVGVNTQMPNKIVKEALEKKLFPRLHSFLRIIPEAKINDKSRLDFALCNDFDIEIKKVDLKTSKTKFHFIEVKNVSLVEDGIAMFPDSVTERGQKHLKDLMQLLDWGHTCEILFTVQRTDAHAFSPATSIDPVYSDLLKKAIQSGVLVSPLLCHLSQEEIYLINQPIPLQL